MRAEQTCAPERCRSWRVMARNHVSRQLLCERGVIAAAPPIAIVAISLQFIER